MSKKGKDRELLEDYISRFEKKDSEWLKLWMNHGLTKLAQQAIRIILKRRGIEP